MPAIKLYPVQVFVSNKISTEGGVINEEIMVFQEQNFFIQSSPDAFEDFP